ncbi:AVIL isoform 3 [Pan troglodytes]|uniref:Advillin n=3 Tax=Pan TaxID=9596 RepID=A0A2I3RNI2_PANTR|nr:AVIL isoform 3 [Pan troglodytes]
MPLTSAFRAVDNDPGIIVWRIEETPWKDRWDLLSRLLAASIREMEHVFHRAPWLLQNMGRENGAGAGACERPRQLL